MAFQFQYKWRARARVLTLVQLVLLFVTAIAWSALHYWIFEEGNGILDFDSTDNDFYWVCNLVFAVTAILIIILSTGVLCLLRATKYGADPISSLTYSLVSVFLYILANLLFIACFLFLWLQFFDPSYFVYDALWDYLPFLVYLLLATVPLIVVLNFIGELKTFIRNTLSRASNSDDVSIIFTKMFDATDYKQKWSSRVLQKTNRMNFIPGRSGYKDDQKQLCTV